MRLRSVFPLFFRSASSGAKNDKSELQAEERKKPLEGGVGGRRWEIESSRESGVVEVTGGECSEKTGKAGENELVFIASREMNVFSFEM